MSRNGILFYSFVMTIVHNSACQSFWRTLKLALGALVYLLNQSGFAGHNSPFISCGFQFSESDGWAKDVCFVMNVKIDKYISYFFVKAFDNKLRLKYLKSAEIIC